MSPDPRPDAKQVTLVAARLLHDFHSGIDTLPFGRDPDTAGAIECATDIIEGLRKRGYPVGPVDALRYAEERLLEDANVEAASRVYERSTWEGLDAGRGRDYERRDALDDSRAALTAAFRSARGDGT